MSWLYTSVDASIYIYTYWRFGAGTYMQVHVSLKHNYLPHEHIVHCGRYIGAGGGQLPKKTPGS